MCKVCFCGVDKCVKSAFWTCKDTHYIKDDQKKCTKYLEILQILAIFAGKIGDFSLRGAEKLGYIMLSEAELYSLKVDE